MYNKKKNNYMFRSMLGHHQVASIAIRDLGLECVLGEGKFPMRSHILWYM
jgi:hypothetical protein